MTETEKPQPQMTMRTWIATEGGRKCPLCGRYAKAEHLGYLGGHMADGNGKVIGHISVYGHLEGCGCNRKEA